MRSNKICGLFVTLNSRATPNLLSLSNSRALTPNSPKILLALSGINGESKFAPIFMLSNKLYKTVESLARFVSSLFKFQGLVSSIYLFARLNKTQSSSSASATLNSSSFA